MYTFISGADRTGDIIDGTITISDELQQRVNSAEFTLCGIPPSEFNDIKMYEGFPILSILTNTIVIKKNYFQFIQNNLFRIGQELTIGIGTVFEETKIISEIGIEGLNLSEFTELLSTYTENMGSYFGENNFVKIIFTENFEHTHAIGEKIGRMRFAGSVIEIQDKNNTILKNIEYNITALDYTRIFDKSLINQVYVNKDARYIVNDFANGFINRNQTLDAFDYATTAELRTKWIESGDGGNPQLETTDYRETTGSGIFDFVHSSGTAVFSQTLIPIVNLSTYTGVSSGQAVDGILGFWIKASDYTKVTSVSIKVGNDTSNYGKTTVILTGNTWIFYTKEMSELSIVGTVDWTSIDYLSIEIIQTATSSIYVDGMRILENDFFKHYPFVSDSVTFEKFNINRVKPSEVMQKLADSLSWNWDINYKKEIILTAKDEVVAPFNISETSNNFNNLALSFDISKLINRQFVKGGDATSTSIYKQVIEGNGVVREWIMKNKFKNLIIKINDGTSTDTAEAGTNTTTINATAHGLLEGDYIVNRSRSNAVRAVLTASDNSFTVLAVSGQTSGDTFSKFVSKLVGVEGLNDETSYNYMSNYNEKSIKSSSTEITITSGQFLSFSYNEVTPILVQQKNNDSIANMQSVLGYSDGVFDGQPIYDDSIASLSEAIDRANSVLDKYANVIITATFQTNQEGLESGQKIRVKDTDSSSRNIDQDFIIQSIKTKQITWGENVYSVTCSSLLFGFLELLQQILASQRQKKINEDEVVSIVESAIETMIIEDIFSSTTGELEIETMIIEDILTVTVFNPPFGWGNPVTNGKPQLTWDYSAWY